MSHQGVELLKEAEQALNELKNQKISGSYRDTYELTSAIGRYLKDVEWQERCAQINKTNYGNDTPSIH